VLTAIPSLTRELSIMEAGRIRIQPLLALLTNTLSDQLMSLKQPLSSSSSSLSSSEAEVVLIDLTRAGLLHCQTQPLAEKLLQAAASMPSPAPSSTGSKGGGKGKKSNDKPSTSHEDAAGPRASAKRVLQALERRHPVPIDAAVNSALGRCHAPAAAVALGDSSDDDADEAMDAAGGAAARKAVFDFVNETFVATGHVACGDTGLTVVAAASAPQAAVRRMAIEQVGEQPLSIDAL